MAKDLITPEIQAGIIEAFESVGGVDYLTEIALRDPPTFCRLLAKIIPAEVQAQISIASVNLRQAMTEADARLNMLESKSDER
jgi:hypothetical protein